MEYNFDRIIDRNNSNSLKHDFPERAGKIGYNYIPMWIADMDFRSPPCVLEALAKKVEHGIFGYSEIDEHYFEAVSGWMLKRHGWRVREEWLVRTSGVINALSVILRSLTNTGDNILVQTPGYNMFDNVIENNGRRVTRNPLVLKNGRYEIDFDDFERQIKRNSVKMFFLCSPHNPIGRVWTKDELLRMGDICLQYGVIVIADEVHEDFVYKPNRHLVFTNLRHEYEKITITCTSPSKTFNMAGLPISNIFITDEDTHDKIADEITARGHLGSGIMEISACQAAYSGGEAWLDALVEYLAGNISLIRNFLKEKIPEIVLIEPEGTYLAWIDCRGIGFWSKELEVFLADEARLLLGGAPGGEGFQRINTACPRSVVQKALEQLEKAVKKKRGF
jgi:cystathionine beta-lyase